MYTKDELKIHLLRVTAILNEFSDQEILPKQIEIKESIRAIEKISEDDLALRLLSTCLQDFPKEAAEITAKIAAEAAAKAIEEGIKAAKAAALLFIKKSI